MSRSMYVETPAVRDILKERIWSTWADSRGQSLAQQLFRYPVAPDETLAIQLLGTARPLWTDDSYWQGSVNYLIHKANGVFGNFSRAGISWGYVDPTFAKRWDDMQAAGLHRSSYHALYTDQSILEQFNKWVSIHPKLDVIPRAIDLEVARPDSYSHKAQATWEMIERVSDYDGVRPTLYSRRALINAWLSPYLTDAQLNSIWYWLAEYLWDRTVEDPGPITAPNGVDLNQILWHQTCDKKPAWSGAVTGSVALDLDRWLVGNAATQNQFIADNWGGSTTPPPPPPTFPLNLGTGKILIPEINARRGPGTGYNIGGKLSLGTKMYYTEKIAKDNDSVWIQVGENLWIASRYQGVDYAQLE